MCGRFTLTKDLGRFLEQLEITFPPQLAHPRRYNIAPGQPVTILVADPGLRVEIAEWGFIPTWVPYDADARAVINARAESLSERKPYFRGAFRSARCAVLADGFFEWKREKKGKIPYRITLGDGELFAMAGLWGTPHAADGAEHPTCAIITVEANDLVRPIHDRMPAILHPEDLLVWLDPRASERDLFKALEPYEAGRMHAYEVGLVVNNARNDVAECIEPVNPGATGLFD
ncbi:MAG TPA: SOS response-associated peptidase [Candidatus Kapabacteria bacterium]|nr:SOS response-associated peptidase [Candidatus Kapabacteria bacterium]